MKIDIIAYDFDDTGREVKVTMCGQDSVKAFEVTAFEQAILLLAMQIVDPK